MIWFFALFVILLGVLIWLTHLRELETFEDIPSSADNMPAPDELFKKARELLERYDKPEIWDQIVQMTDKDPGALARMQLGIENHQNGNK
jgi:hypothetical protein